MSGDTRALVESVRSEHEPDEHGRCTQCMEWWTEVDSDGKASRGQAITSPYPCLPVRLAEALAESDRTLELSAAMYECDVRSLSASAERLAGAAKELADHFIRKTINLVTMRCNFCLSEWVRDCPPEHETDCPVGEVSAALGLAAGGEQG